MIHWNSFADFIAMGGYGFYVWGSFGVTALVMVIEPILVARNQRASVARLKRQLRAEQRAHKNDAEALGIAVAEDLLAQGAGEILAALYAEETPVT